MGRRFRNLLTGGLLGAMASLALRFGRKRMFKKRRRTFNEKAGHHIRMVLEQISKLGILGRRLPSRRRIR